MDEKRRNVPRKRMFEFAGRGRDKSLIYRIYFEWSFPKWDHNVKYQIKKIAEIQTFQRFLFCPFSSKISKILKSQVYKSGTVEIEVVLFIKKHRNHLIV